MASRRRRSKYFGKSARRRDAVGGRAAGRADEVADQARAQPQPDRRQRARRAGHHRDGRAGPHHRGDGQARARRARRRSCTTRAPARSITPPTTSWTCSTTRSARSTRTSSSPPRSTRSMQAAAERALTDELNAKGDEVRRRAGRAGRARPRRRRQGAGRRAQLRRQPVQPRRRRQAPARLVVQAVRLSRRAGEGPDARHGARGRADHGQGLEPGELFSREYFGPVTLTKALALSLNTVAVRLGLEVGPKTVVRTAHRLGITSELEPNASIALGTSEVTPLEMVSAYAAFANGGIGVQPHVIATRAHRQRQAALSRQQRQFRPRHRPAIRRDDEFDDGGDAADRHRAQGGAAGLAGGRQDRHQPGLARRVVRRLHQRSSSPASGSATTTIRRPRRLRAAICRSRSGAAS